MDPDCDRNPSPPPELLENDEDLVPDKLGDSVFSKHWLFQTLIKIIEGVNKGSDDASSSPSVQRLCEGRPKEPETDVVELDPALEEDACTLWDMSANHDVACFLQEFSVAEIFLEVMEKTRSPRLLEIVVGILGNIVSFDELCKDVSKNSGLINAVVRLSGSSDAPTVIQVLRLIHTGIVNEHTKELWITAIKSDLSFTENLRFIFENSLNGEVLKRGLQLLYYLLDKEDLWCLEWGKENSVRAVIEAGKQLNSLKNFEALDEFWMVLNLLCLYEDNIRTLGVHFLNIFEIFVSYMWTIEDYEDILPPVHRITAVAAAVSTTSTFLKFKKENHEYIVKDNTFTSFLFRMLKSVCETVQLEESKSRGAISGEMSSDLCSSLVVRTPEVCVESQMDNGFCFSGALGKKIPSYNSCITKTSEDFNNLLVLRESLEEFCVIIRPVTGTEKE